MDIQDTSAAVYSEAKSEYTKQLVFNIQPVLLRFFLDRYTEAKASSTVTAKTKSALSEFQDSLSHIPEWNLDKVQRETSILLQGIHCDYMEDLITAVFIAHTKILSAIRLHAKPRRKIQITIPKPDHFMHRALSESSRLLWSNVYLFSDSASSLDRQKNMNDVNRFLEEGILQAIRNLLPVKSILRDSLQEDDDDIVKITGAGDSEEQQGVSNNDASIPMPETPVEPAITETPVIPVVTEAPVETPIAPFVPVVAPLIQEPLPTIDLSGGNLNTLVIDTEKSVGFTGIDSLLGAEGDAELRPMIDEASDEFKILGESEGLDLSEFEDIDAPPMTPTPLAADDYESI